MPLRKRLDRHIQEVESSLTRTEVEQLAADSMIERVQCSSPVEPNTWNLLNEVLFARRPEIELRLYGFYSFVCDLSFLTQVRNVRRFSADCIMNAVSIDCLGCLVNLDQLSVGIYNLQSFDFLELIPSGIETLFLAATKSKKPRLDALARFHSLRKLYLEGQQQGIETLSKLLTLEEVTLRSISTQDLDYVSGLPRLWSLDIKLGGIRDFSSIANKQTIKYLELWQIRGLSNLSFVSSLTGLQFIFLQSLRNVIKIPDLSRLSKLRRLHLENMKGLKDVSAIAHAPVLEEFSHFSAENAAPEQYTDVLRMPTLKSVRVGFGSRRKNEDFEELAARYGKNSDGADKLGKRFVFV
jgi:hypothetical protein